MPTQGWPPRQVGTTYEKSDGSVVFVTADGEVQIESPGTVVSSILTALAINTSNGTGSNRCLVLSGGVVTDAGNNTVDVTACKYIGYAGTLLTAPAVSGLAVQDNDTVYIAADEQPYTSIEAGTPDSADVPLATIQGVAPAMVVSDTRRMITLSNS